MQIKSNRNGMYEKLFPITLADNVIMNNNKSVEAWKREVDEFINNIGDSIDDMKKTIAGGVYEDISLWKGTSLLDATTEITPNKPIDLCRNGWLLIFRYTGANNNLNYIQIPKHHLKVAAGGGVKVVLGSASGTYVQKYVYINSSTLTGHSSNSTGGNEKMELINIYEY